MFVELVIVWNVGVPEGAPVFFFFVPFWCVAILIVWNVGERGCEMFALLYRVFVELLTCRELEFGGSCVCV